MQFRSVRRPPGRRQIDLALALLSHPRFQQPAPTANLTGCSSRRTIDPERIPPMTDTNGPQI